MTSRKIASLLLLLSIIMTACASGTATPTSSVVASQAAPATQAPAPTAAPTSAPQKQIVILSDDIPAGLDPDGPSNSVPAVQEGIANLADPLVEYAPKGPNSTNVNLLDFSKFEGRLAQSWDYDPATLTWTFHLRHDVVGCDGEKFTADDVLYTFARAKSVSGSGAVGWFLASVASVKGFTSDVFSTDKAKAAQAQVLGDEVKKIDDYTVQITQSAPNQLLLPVLTIFALKPFSKQIMQQHATSDDPWTHQWNNTVGYPGFGAYCLQSWTKDSEFIVTANPNYYRGKPPIDRIIYRKVAQETDRYAALASGDAQVIEHLSMQTAQTLLKNPNVTVASVTGNENMFMGLNYKIPPFDNIKVRQALAYAIPYDQIVQTAYFGSAKKWDMMVPSTYPDAFEPSAPYTYDLAKAKQLLADAGYPGGAGLNTKFPDSWTLSYVSEREGTLGPAATIIKSALASLGITVQLNPLPETQFDTHLITKNDLPMMLDDLEKPIAVDSGYAMLLFFVSKKNGGLVNFVNYDNPAFDALYAKMIVEPDKATRSDDLHQMENMMQNELPWVPIVEYPTIWGTAKNLSGITWYADNDLRWYDLSLK